MIITHFLHLKHIPNINSLQIIFFTDSIIFQRTIKPKIKNPLSNPLSKNLLKLFVYLHGYTLFCFTNYSNSSQNYCNEYLKSLSNKFLANASRLEVVYYGATYSAFRPQPSKFFFKKIMIFFFKNPL